MDSERRQPEAGSLQEALVRLVADAANRPQDSPPTAEDLGYLGRFFGGRLAGIYIAGVAVLVAGLLLFSILVLTAWLGPLEYGREIITGSFSLASLALGYVFGVSKR